MKKIEPKKNLEELQKSIKKNIGSAIVAAFAFIIALVWRDAIVSLVAKITELLGITGKEYLPQLLSALLTTVICVIGIQFFSKWQEN